jgi:hypothetical protein
MGASLNLTAACPSRNDQTCKISCQDPTSPNRCVLLDSLLIDGSPCGQLTLFSMLCNPPFPHSLSLRRTILTGYGGTCTNGTCQSASAFNTAKVTKCALVSFLIGPEGDRSRNTTSLSPWIGTVFSHRHGICKIYRSQFRSLSRLSCSLSPYSGVSSVRSHPA